jgi:cytidine deaminase
VSALSFSGRFSVSWVPAGAGRLISTLALGGTVLRPAAVRSGSYPRSVDDDQLVGQALAVRERAYAPYSGYRVGAALLGASGRVYPGVNVENASYPVGLCAERAAVAAAVTRGERRFTAVAVAVDGPSPGAPCGLCRQTLYEFAPDLRVIMAAVGGARRTATLADLLPDAFGPGHLGNA